MSTGAKPTSWRIDLEKDPSTQKYVPGPFDTGEIPLKQGDLVFWKLSPAPAISLGYTLRFIAVGGSPLTHPLGPFTRIDQIVEEEDGQMVLTEWVASGFNGSLGEFSYEIQQPELTNSPPRPTLNIGLSTSDPPNSNETQQTSVSIELPAGAAPRLRVVPEKLSIRPGQHAVWSFDVPFNLFPGEVWVPTVQFTSTPRDPLGPFAVQTSFISVGRDDRDKAQPRSIQLIFSGRQSLAKVPPGSHDYAVAIETPTGKFVASGDPAIDDDGDVMPAPPKG